MTHPAEKYDEINADFPSPDDEREEARMERKEAWLFLSVVVFGVLTAVLAVITYVVPWIAGWIR